MANSSRQPLPAHYARFLQAWSDAPRSNMALLWPAGAGAVGAVGQLIAGLGRSQRVLVVAERLDLAQQMVARLESDGITARLVDRFVYRELQSTTDIDQPDWSESGVFVVTASFVGQADVLASVERQHWDLVVLLDTSNAVAARMVKTFSSAAKRMLWKVRTGVASSAVDASAWVLNEVSIDQLLAARGLPVAQAPQIVIRVFSVCPSPAEEAISPLVQRVIETSKGTSAERLAASLRARSMSSPAALEGGLRRLESELGKDWPLWSAAVDEADIESRDDTHQTEVDLASIQASIRSCLRALDAIDSDSKLKCLVDVLGRRAPSQAIAVFVRYRDTGSYLHAALEDLAVPSTLIHGAMLASDIGRRTHEFLQQDGGLLVMTTAMLLGIDLGKVRHLVLYDPPASPEAMATLLARFHVVGVPQLHVSVVTDERSAAAVVDLVEQASRFVF